MKLPRVRNGTDTIYTHAGMTQGHGGLYVNKQTRSKKKINSQAPRYDQLVRWVRSHADLCDVSLQPLPSDLRSHTGGVQINGKKWGIGQPCFFKLPGRGRDPKKIHFGTVTHMYHWADRFEETLIVRVERHVLNGANHSGWSPSFWVEPLPNLSPVLIFWNQITHRCKMYPRDRDGTPVMGVVRVAATQPIMDGIDFNGFM
jgi:hypothetical protein